MGTGTIFRNGNWCLSPFSPTPSLVGFVLVRRIVMYVPKYFEETRIKVMHELMRSHPFATLVTLSSDGLGANHIPLEVHPDPAPFGTLRGHIARANPLWQELSSDVNALAIFQGTNRYISPAWYP